MRSGAFFIFAIVACAAVVRARPFSKPYQVIHSSMTEPTKAFAMVTVLDGTKNSAVAHYRPTRTAKKLRERFGGEWVVIFRTDYQASSNVSPLREALALKYTIGSVPYYINILAI